MTGQKTNKKALLTSALSLLLCCTMLIGTTWAWFTDSVTSSGNKIQSGTLQIDLLVKDGNTGKTEYTSVKDGELANKPIFNYELWEPGYTLVTYAQVINRGNLALKYTLNFTSGSNIAEAKLAKVIDVYYAPSEVAGITERTDLTTAVENGTLRHLGTLQDVFAGGEALAVNDHLDPKGKGNDEDFATIVLKMQETADNYYQGMTIPAFDICLLATQWTYERDSFDDQYDVNATLNFAPVSSAAAFNNALSAGKQASLNNDVALPEPYEVLPGQTVVINGNGNEISADSGSRIINVNDAAGASVELNDVNLESSDKERALSIYGSENANIDINNSSVSAKMYALNLASDSPNTEINVDNSTVTGWCAVQSWSPDSEITFTNSTLIGNNQWSGTSNAFATIVVNAPATNNTFVFRNCTIEANQYGDQSQWFALFKTASNMVFENCKFKMNGTEVTDLEQIIDNFAFTTQEAIDGSTLVINGETILPQ